MFTKPFTQPAPHGVHDVSVYLRNQNRRPEHRLQQFDHRGPLGDVEDVRGGQREVVPVEVEAQRRKQPAVNNKLCKYRSKNSKYRTVNAVNTEEQ